MAYSQFLVVSFLYSIINLYHGPKEFQENETITVDNVEISQSVNIFGCKGTTVIINGKVNAVNLSTAFLPLLMLT